MPPHRFRKISTRVGPTHKNNNAAISWSRARPARPLSPAKGICPPGIAPWGCGSAFGRVAQFLDALVDSEVFLRSTNIQRKLV